MPAKDVRKRGRKARNEAVRSIRTGNDLQPLPHRECELLRDSLQYDTSIMAPQNFS